MATELFAERTYEGTAVPDVLAAAGVSRGALYHHFDSKEALFEAVLESVESQVPVTVAQAVAGLDDPVEVLRVGCATFVGLAQDPTYRQIMLVDGPAVLGWRRWRAIDDRYGLGLVKATVRAIMDSDRAEHLDPVSPDVLAQVLLAGLIELVLLVADADESLSASEAEVAVDSLISRLFQARNRGS